MMNLRNELGRLGALLGAAIFFLGIGAVATAKPGQGSDRGSPQGGQHACPALAANTERLECAQLLIDIAGAYLDSITSPVDWVPELPGLLAPDVKRWTNRSHSLEAPNLQGRDAMLQAVSREPVCSFENRRWIVEGSIDSGRAIVDFDAFCTGFPGSALVTDSFTIENGQITEVETRFM